MALRFVNIKRPLVNGKLEELVADDEPKIAALWGSSDRSPNASQGQDMGWRMAPEVVVEMKEIMADPSQIQEIANRFRKMYEDVTESDVLTWISGKTELMDAPVATTEDYANDYQAEIARLELERKSKVAPTAKTTTETTTESLADMEKRAELAERIAKANSAAETTTTTTTVKDTTSTTPKK